MYRHTVKDTEPLSDGTDLVTYYQTNWDSIANYIPRKGRKVVKTEEKEVEVES